MIFTIGDLDVNPFDVKKARYIEKHRAMKITYLDGSYDYARGISEESAEEFIEELDCYRGAMDDYLDWDALGDFL
jgi:hypothetical protein